MAVPVWSTKTALYEFDYDTGTHSPVVGEVINVDVAAGETAVVHAWTVASGDWGTSDAVGKMWVYSASADFITNLVNDDNIDDSGDTQICITTGGVTAKAADWGVAGSWGSGEDPAVPVAADEVIFDSTSVITPTTTMAIGDTGGKDYDLLYFKSTYTGGIGATTVPLHTSAQKIIIEGSGTYYIEIAETGTGADQVVPLMIINNKDATVYLSGEDCDSTNVCEITDLYIIAGTVYIGNDGTSNNPLAVQNLYIYPKNNKSSNVTVYIDDDVERVTAATPYAMSIYMSNGVVTSDSAAALIDMAKGTFTYGTEGGGGTTDQVIASLRLAGGTFNWVPESTGGAPSITKAYLLGGVFDSSSTVNDDVAKTIGTVYIFSGATFDIENNMGNITVTSLYNHKGTVVSDAGVKMAITYNQP